MERGAVLLAGGLIEGGGGGAALQREEKAPQAIASGEEKGKRGLEEAE